MNRFHVLTAVPVLFAAGLFSLPTAAPVRGPGAVMEALKQFVQAVDQGDRVHLERAFTDLRHRDRYSFDDTGKLVQLPGEFGELSFQDVGADGSVLVRNDRKGAIAALLDGVGGKGLGLKTRIRSICADCPGPECSWATVELDRSFLRGEEKVTIPLRATVLVRYQDEEPRMRIFLWHCSAVPTTAPAKAK